MSILEDYNKAIEFEVILPSKLTVKEIEKLNVKYGLVIETDTTDLWIRRELKVYDVLGKSVVMEDAFNYCIIDSFGITMWDGDADSIVTYIDGWFNEEDEEL